MSLKGKNALVTGSTSGIGLAVAKQLAGNGCNIMLNGFGDPKEIDTLVKQLKKDYKVRVFYHDADLSRPSHITAMMEAAQSQMGSIDVLVNNAGIQYTSRIEDFPPEKWDDIIAINLSAVFHTTRLALPGMYAQNWGRIINIASTHGLVASPEKCAYVAAKHAVVGFTKVTALEAAESNITCNAICPGYVHTPLVEKQIVAKAAEWGMDKAEATRAFLAEKHPTMRFTQPNQIGDMVVFLCSDAATNMTGISWPVDGGWTIR